MDRQFLRVLHDYLDEMERSLTGFSGRGGSALLPERFRFWLQAFHFLMVCGGLERTEEIAGLSEAILIAQEAAVFRKKGWPRKKTELLFQTVHLLRQMLAPPEPASCAGDFANRIAELRIQLARSRST